MAGKKRDKNAWKQNKFHDVTLPSGTEVTIKLPDLTRLIEGGQIPQDLLDAALGYVQGDSKPEKPTPESVKRDREFRDHLVKVTVTDPEVTDEDLGDDGIPTEDKDMIVEFAMRARDMDVLGHHISGLHTSEDFRAFRQLDS